MPRQRRPDPPPLETDDVRISAVGTAAWLVALVVLLIVGMSEDRRWWLWVCVTGACIGAFGVLYIPRLQRSRAEATRRHVAATGHPTELPVPDERSDRS
ncbi:DUF2530 domain-containing protein [Actinomadura craniellae]|uniref:DUF2530 domain-containing protein n=1 Tax=Actinomadura craniellae TaxID=2231787 RepID=A0A365H8U9_9ACTN|nr:DUF2530 domain-containing protein [Actinomadura craniellae]RAY15501.1 DUF2530 domain-containing protein [Actinomadura craniellae]